tara:strand:+ start:562 stop:942 length:381 start_codon:yes stop_codon:yes gene_type:complete
MTQDLKYRCKHYVNQLGIEGSSDALHALIELPNDAIPILMCLYYEQHDSGIRGDIVHSIWQHRCQDSKDWLLEILKNEEHEEIWQEALDGLMTLGVKHELSSISIDSPRKTRFIKEAIELLEQGYA